MSSCSSWVGTRPLTESSDDAGIQTVSSACCQGDFPLVGVVRPDSSGDESEHLPLVSLKIYLASICLRWVGASPTLRVVWASGGRARRSSVPSRWRPSGEPPFDKT